ncbi:NCS2 family permease [Mycoplasma iguanae]|uniref:NCS2 family permease n=1 Tax=Mycoplasma iguanae TaxID=292461 RepID=A0ABY5R807_9MOLU|nr:NCS2 family permease [Mycoplasma iguanae]UVD81618.1 NCS2 family permease [Mycoplasma iguanae]
MRWLSNYFQFEVNKTTWSKEIIGGLSTFLAMIYILSVNPAILSSSWNVDEGSKYIGALFLGTALSSFIGTILIGFFAKAPLAMAPGMGLNAFFAFSVAKGFGLGFDGALIAVFFSGILYFIVTTTPLRQWIINVFPKNFKIAISVLIGLFIGYIGLQDAGLITSSPATLTQIGDLSNPIVIIGFLSLIIFLILYYLKVPGSILIGILISFMMLLITWLVTKNNNYTGTLSSHEQYLVALRNNFQIQSYGDMTQFGELIKHSWSNVGNVFKNPLFYISILTFFYFDFFDSAATFVLVSRLLNKSENENKKFFKKANITDGVATIFGSVLLSSSVTTYVESTVGIKSGAKTGFASIITALMFLVSIAFYPILKPFFAIYNPVTQTSISPITGPILVLIGILIMNELRNFDWSIKLDLPVLITIILFGVLGFSISKGIAFGSIIYFFMHKVVYALLFVFSNKKEEWKNSSKKELFLQLIKYELNWSMLTLTILSVAYLIVESLIHNGVIAA